MTCGLANNYGIIMGALKCYVKNMILEGREDDHLDTKSGM